MSAGDYELEDTVYLPFTTRAFATGIPTVLAGTPVVEIYEDASVTQITAAETLTVSVDGVVGFNICSVAATAANGFGNGQSYTAIISTGTVGGVSVVGEVIGHFTVGMSAAFLRLGAPAGASVSADIAVIEGQTDDIGVAGAGLTALVDLVWDEVLTGVTHNVVNSAGRRLRQLQEAGGYNGSVWLDTVNGVAGTTDFENGVDTNPVDTIADTNTIAASIGLSRIQVAPGSSVTFAAAQQNQVFNGHSWTLALGGQNIDGSTIIGANVSGIATNTAGIQYFISCLMGACTYPADTHIIDCGVSGTQTIGEAGDYFFAGCHSGIAGTATWVLDFAAVGATNVNCRHYSGGVELQNMTALDAISIEGDGQVIINANCTGGAVVIRGNFDLTDNSGGAVTITETARPGSVLGQFAFTVANQVDSNAQYWNDTIISTALETSADVADAVLDEDMTAHQTTGSLGAAIGDGDAGAGMTALASAANLATVDTNIDNLNLGIIYGTAQTGTLSTTACTTDLTGYLDDELIGGVIVFTGGTADGQRADITDYAAASGLVTFSGGITTAPANGDPFKIV